MLELFEYDAPENTGGITAYLDEAYQIRVSKEINSSDNLSFIYPSASDKAELITVNKLVRCDGQLYRIMKVSKGDEELSADCMHIWFADASAVHIPTVPDNIGVSPEELIISVADSCGSEFVPIKQDMLQTLGLSWLGRGDFSRDRIPIEGNEFKIDFFAADKTNLLDFVKTVISNAGFGEMYYVDNAFAIVEQLGHETNIRLDLASNMESINVETDISSMITRLYPYGCDDLTIGAVNGECYIDSPNTAVYGLKSGYKDYSDYTDPDMLLSNAKWEFDQKNTSRIDVPSVTITGSVRNLEKYVTGGNIYSLSLGDTVTVSDERGTEFSLRVTAMNYYPYENRPAEITLGRVKRDLFFYISQIAQLAKNYSRCATNSGKISARSISGTRTSSSVSAPLFKLSYNGGLRAITAGDDGVYIDGNKIITENENKSDGKEDVL